MKQENNDYFKDLKVNLAGVNIRTPVGVGSVGFPCIKRDKLTHEMHADILLKHIEAGAGYICLPITCHVPDTLLKDLEKKARPFPSLEKSTVHPAIFMRADEKRLSMYNVPPSPARPPSGTATVFQRDTAGLITVLREKKPKDIPLIGNLAGLGSYPETYVAGAKALEQSKVDLIELNLSSPASLSLWEMVDCYFEDDFPLTHIGFFMGDQPELVEKVVREVVKAVDVPVGVKFSAETGFPRIVDLARRVKSAGATFITCSNFGITIVSPDIYNKGKSKWPHMDDNPFTMVAGDWLRPVIYKQVAAIGKFVPDIDIMACGGLVTPEHVVEAMMLGAKAVQKVTPVLYSGRKLIERDIRFLKKYITEQGYHDVNDFIGLGQQHIKPASEIHSVYEKKSLFANVDVKMCNGCGICTDGNCLALHIEGKLVKVEVDKCIGCGLCVAVCPTNAMYLSES